MSSYSSLDIAISMCRHTELYKLYNYKNVCDRIELEIDKVLKPSRQKVLRGYYLMNSLNKSIDAKSDNMLKAAENNAGVTGFIQTLQDDIYDIVTKVRENIEESYKTYIDINKESDAQILSRFRDEPRVNDLIHIRNVLTQARESTTTPINLTSSNMAEIGYNNRRIEGNSISLRKSGEKLGTALALSKKHAFIKEVIYKAINIQTQLIDEGLEDYIKTHTNEEVKEWLYGRIS